MEKIAILGLGYVGLPVALAFARKFKDAIGFDIHDEKVKELARGYDRNHEVSEDELKASTLKFTSDPNDLRDLTPVIRASETVGRVIGKGAVVVFESTVYPGVTEEICGPVIAKLS